MPTMNQPPTQPAVTARAKMQVVTVFDLEHGVRTHQMTGVINLRALQGILQGLYSSKQFNPDMNAFWDLRLADFSCITPEDVREIMHVVVNNWGGPPGTCRCAILVASLAEFGVARIYMSQFGRAAPCEIKIFLELSEARQWLGLGAVAGEAVTPSNQRNDHVSE